VLSSDTRLGAQVSALLGHDTIVVGQVVVDEHDAAASR
jgi:hypothetical protein